MPPLAMTEVRLGQPDRAAARDPVPRRHAGDGVGVDRTGPAAAAGTAHSSTTSGRLAGLVKRLFGWSSMPTTFEAPIHADRMLAKARELALLFLGGTLPEGDDIGRQPEASNFKSDRLDRSARASRGLEVCHC